MSDMVPNSTSKLFPTTASACTIAETSPPLETRFKLGLGAEALVKTNLEELGWNCIAMNYRGVGFEIDIIASKGATLIGVEVKLRRSWTESMETLQGLLPKNKILRLKKGLEKFLHHEESGKSIHWKYLRIDLAVVIERRRPNGEGWREIKYFVGAGNE